MNKQEIDAMLEAQREYEKARVTAYYGTPDMDPRSYQFVSLPTLRAVERAVGTEAKLAGEGPYATYQIEYGGCLFQAPAGRAD